jgi:hypothetical protein
VADDPQADNPYAPPLVELPAARMRERMTWLDIWLYGASGILGINWLLYATRQLTGTGGSFRPVGYTHGVVEFVCGALLVGGSILRFAGYREGKYFMHGCLGIVAIHLLSIWAWAMMFD